MVLRGATPKARNNEKRMEYDLWDCKIELIVDKNLIKKLKIKPNLI